MSAMSVRLPESLHRKARQSAEREGVSINQLVATALAEKLSALLTVEYLEERARRGDRRKFERALRLWFFFAAALLYGSTAVAVAVGLWGMRAWAFRACFVWVGSLALVFALMIVTPPWSALPFYQWALFLAVVLAILGALGLYIRRKVGAPRAQGES